MEISILEGARGTGKSTLAFRLRQRISPTPTLINFTGFHDDDEVGLEKVSHYYEAMMMMLFNLAEHDSEFVFDRFYFSELVYSKLYKNYDFRAKFHTLTDLLHDLSSLGVKINIFYLTINDKEELKERLIRDKVPFGKAEENVEETLKQQYQYKLLFKFLQSQYSNSNLKIYTIDTSNKTNDDVYAEILQLKTTN